MQFAKYTILFMRHTANIMNIYHSFFIPQFYCHSAGFPFFFYYLIRGELKDKTGRLTEGRRKRRKRSVGRQWGEEILITTVRRANLSITSSGRREPPRPWIDIVRWENICIIFILLHQQNYLKILFQKEIFFASSSGRLLAIIPQDTMMQTCPPTKRNFTGVVNQWVIYDR